MKVTPYQEIDAVSFDSDVVKGVQGRIAIGRDDGAPNFCMRVFEVEPKGFTPCHSHDWEHEIFVHSGEGEVYQSDQWRKVKPGSVVFIPGNELHQIRNRGMQKLVFVCLIPSGAPEL